MRRIRCLGPTPSKTMAYTSTGAMSRQWEAMVGIADRKVMGGRIKTLRKAKHWPQKHLALMVGIRFEQLNKYESGLNTPPVDTLVRLAEALDTTVDYLLTGTFMDEAKFANARLFRRLQALEQLDEEDQQALIRIIDAMVSQQRMVSVLAPVD